MVQTKFKNYISILSLMRGGEGALDGPAMDGDDDVEMEFISVMGVLVPLEVTKGVSDEAKRFAAGGIPSDEEALEVVQDPIPVANVEDTETKCTNSDETQCRCSEPSSSTIADSRGQCVGRSDPAEAQKPSVFGGEEAGSLELEEAAAKTQTTTKSPVKIDTMSAEQTQLTKVKQKTNVKDDRGLSAEDSTISKKKHEIKSTTARTNGGGNLNALRGEVQQSDKPPSKKKMPGSLVTSKRISTPEDKTQDKTTKSAKLKLASPSCVSVTGSQCSPTPISKPKRRAKRSRIAEDEANTKSGRLKHRKSEPAAGGVKARRFGRGNKAHHTKDDKCTSKATKFLTSASADDTTSNATEDTITVPTSSDQARCAYPGCTQSARYKSRCSNHNGRARCSLSGCAKFAHSGGKCIAHGGGARCMEDGCKSRARSMGKCYAHGGGIVCSHPECTTRAKTKGKCVAHGGGTLCSKTGCDKLSISDGKCIAHGGWMKCSHPGCSNRVYMRRKCINHAQQTAAAGTHDTDKGLGQSSIKSGEVAVNDNDHKHPRRPPGNYMEVKAKLELATERTKHNTTDLAEMKSVKERKMVAKRRRKISVAATASVEQEAMSLRSGQQIARVTDSRYDLQSEEEALQIALKLSEIEY